MSFLLNRKTNSSVPRSLRGYTNSTVDRRPNLRNQIGIRFADFGWTEFLVNEHNAIAFESPHFVKKKN